MKPFKLDFWPDEETGCWVWLGLRNSGYGKHRAVYEVLVGPIPSGYVLDHLCCNKACVNPAHLEPVTLGENSRRGGRPHDGKLRPREGDLQRQQKALYYQQRRLERETFLRHPHKCEVPHWQQRDSTRSPWTPYY